MSSGTGPFDGTVTFPKLGGNGIEDLVLRVVAEGWGHYAGITVEDRDGESVDLPFLDWVVIGTVTHEDGSLYRHVAIPYDELRKVLRNKAERIEDARSQLRNAEAAVERARDALAKVEAGEVPATS